MLHKNILPQMPTFKHLYVVRMIAAFLFLPYEHVGFPEFAVNDVDRIFFKSSYTIPPYHAAESPDGRHTKQVVLDGCKINPGVGVAPPTAKLRVELNI